MSLLGGGINVEAGMALGLRLASGIEAQNQLLRDQMRQNYRRSVPLVGGLAGIVGQTAVKVLQGPEGGFEWHLRRITFAPPISGTIATQGTLIVGKGTGLQTSGANGEGQLVGSGGGNFIEITRTSTVPNTITLSSTQGVIKYPNNLIVLWVAGSGQLVIDGDCEELLLARQLDFEA
jgi:hypothetical protein